MKTSELKQKPKGELEKALQDDREKLRQLRFDLSAGKVKNVRGIRQTKKDIARILTLITESRKSGTKVKMRTESSSPLKK
jgi:large subunit ribosomal protein L29